MKKGFKNTALLLVVTLCGCNLAPEYKRPEAQITETPIEIIAPEVAKSNCKKSCKAGNPSTPKVQAFETLWQDFFKNEELQELISLALFNNKDMRISVLNIMAAQEFYRIKRADSLPSLSLDFSYSRSRAPGNSVIGFGGNFASSGNAFIIDNYRANLATGNFELDLFSRLKNINKAAFEDFWSKIEERNALQISLIAEVANAYLQWISDLEKLEIAQKSLEIEEKRFNLVKKSYEAGILSKIELEKAKSELNLVKTDLARAGKLALEDKNILILLTAEKNDERLKKVALADFSLGKQLDTEIKSQYLLLRPDIQKAEADLRAKNANIGAARAAFFPSFSITGSYGFASTKFSNLFSSNSRGSWSFGPSINLPIFEGGKNLANLKTAKIEREIAVEKYQKTIKVAFKEVFDELAAKKALKTQMQSATEILESNRKIYALNEKLHKIGSRNLIDLINDEHKLLSAQASEVEARRQYLMNRINLYKALGGGI